MGRVRSVALENREMREYRGRNLGAWEVRCWRTGELRGGKSGRNET